MSRIPIEDYLAKLIRLEESVGARTSYQILDPFHVNVRDPIDLQKAAKRIATFVGLENLTFIIGVAKQKENVAGHIDLRNYYGTDVFIEVSNQALIFPQAVLARENLGARKVDVHVLGFGCELVDGS